MKIKINNSEIEVIEGEKLIEAAHRNNFEIPALCYAKGYQHHPSCMVCIVKDKTSNQIIPSCSAVVAEGMDIETDSDEVKLLRKTSLELLLSDHRADCEAPCSMVCPQDFNVEKMLMFYDSGQIEEAFSIIAETFTLSELECDKCKVPCEKACRRGTVDEAVSIREIIKEIVKKAESLSKSAKDKLLTRNRHDKEVFCSRLGRLTSVEKEFLKETVKTKSRCLHCACAGREGCKLRKYATEAGIKRTQYELSSVLPAMNIKTLATDNIRFEPAKCIKCGLCVYNSVDGFTFKNRGFGMEVVLPEESVKNIDKSLCGLCPTGALYC